MNNNLLIINKLEKLKDSYKQYPEKKWNMKAISNAINSLKSYDKEIISGKQVKEDIKGIGDKISIRIDEILNTGDLSELQDEPDSSLNNLLDITGVGNIRAKKWLLLGIKNINDVKKAINEKKITTTHHIDIGIKYYNDLKQKIPRYEIDNIKIYLNNILKKIDNFLIFEICGSYRRNCIESNDIDILISSNKSIKTLDKIVDELIQDNFIIDSITNKGGTKFMGICLLNGYKTPRRIDIRVVNYKSYYSSLLYFTGNKNFNLYIRNKALQKNYSLNEYFLTDLNDNSTKYLDSEKEIFDLLNIPYLDPNERNL